MNTGRGGWLISSRVQYIQICPLRLALLGVRLSRHRVDSWSYTYQYSYSLAVHNRRLQASQLDRRECLLRCMCLISVYFRGLYRDIGRAHTSCAHFNWIFELMSSLRSNYVLYMDTMPLIIKKLAKSPNSKLCQIKYPAILYTIKVSDTSISIH